MKVERITKPTESDLVSQLTLGKLYRIKEALAAPLCTDVILPAEQRKGGREEQ